MIAITETWLHSLISDDLVKFDNHVLMRHGRQVKRGGGIAVYVHESLKVKVLELSPNSTLNDSEYIISELSSSDNHPVLFSTIYRRLKGTLFTEFLNVISRHSFAYSNIIINGDLNCDLLNVNFESRFLKDLVVTSRDVLIILKQ